MCYAGTVECQLSKHLVTDRTHLLLVPQCKIGYTLSAGPIFAFRSNAARHRGPNSIVLSFSIRRVQHVNIIIVVIISALRERKSLAYRRYGVTVLPPM